MSRASANRARTRCPDAATLMSLYVDMGLSQQDVGAICGVSASAIHRGLVRAGIKRRPKNGDEPESPDALKARFMSKVNMSDGCWTWAGSTGREGYGRIRVHGQSQRAHRVAFELFVGPVPAGLFVCHHCDNPSCVRPEHLYAGTHQQNVDDRAARGRGDAGFRALSPLSEADVVTIRRMVHNGVSPSDAGSHFGVGRCAVTAICLGKTWADVGGPIHEPTPRKERGRLRWRVAGVSVADWLAVEGKVRRVSVGPERWGLAT